MVVVRVDSLTEAVEARTESQQMSSDDVNDLNQVIKDYTIKIVKLETEKIQRYAPETCICSGTKQLNQNGKKAKVIKSLTNDRNLRQDKINQLRLNPKNR